jgi:hypothetical protein
VDDEDHLHTPEAWTTKQRLAEHVSVTPRWIELQQRRGLPTSARLA